MKSTILASLDTTKERIVRIDGIGLRILNGSRKQYYNFGVVNE